MVIEDPCALRYSVLDWKGHSCIVAIARGMVSNLLYMKTITAVSPLKNTVPGKTHPTLCHMP